MAGLVPATHVFTASPTSWMPGIKPGMTIERRIFRCIRKTFVLQVEANSLIWESPNFARACGRVVIGGHPDKRPDSRLRK